MKRFLYWVIIWSFIGSSLPVNSFALEDAAPRPNSEQFTVPPEPTTTLTHDPVVEFVESTPQSEEVKREDTVSFSPLEAVAANVVPTAHVVQLAPVTVSAKDDVLVNAVQVDIGGLSAMELKNTNDKPVLLEGRSLKVVYTDGTEYWGCQVNLSGYLLGRTQTTYAQEGVTLHRDDDSTPYFAEFTCAAPPEADSVNQRIFAIDVWNGQELLEHVQLAGVTGTWLRKGTGVSTRTGTFLTDFKSSVGYEFMTMDLYYPPVSSPFIIRELHINPMPCAPADESILCQKYIKVTNTSEKAIDLSLYRLRSGSMQTAATTANTSDLSGIIAAGETVLLQKRSDGTRLYIAAGEGTVWLQDKNGLQDYLSDVVPYSGASNTGNRGLAWAFDTADATWKWSLPTPFAAKNEIRLPAPDLKTATPSSSSLVPCKSGQYRSEETNRCRSLTLTASTLVPCKDNQYRSEETNRCRTVTTASTNLVPCRDDQYRSEQTHRCRTIAPASIPEAAFAVTPVQETGRAFVGWWALGGVGVLAVGYGAWEWRREVRTAVRRVGEFFTSHR